MFFVKHKFAVFEVGMYNINLTKFDYSKKNKASFDRFVMTIKDKSRIISSEFY